MVARESRPSRLLALGLSGLLAGACATGSYEPLVLTADKLPADAFARCHDLLLTRFGRLVVMDASAFRLQTDWAPMSNSEIAGQQRATLFREPDGLGVVVEARYLDRGWFGRLPEWTPPRPDARLEGELVELLEGALVGEAEESDG